MAHGYMWIVSVYENGKLINRYSAMCVGLQAVNDHCKHHFPGIENVSGMSDDNEQWFENGCLCVVYER